MTPFVPRAILAAAVILSAGLPLGGCGRSSGDPDHTAPAAPAAPSTRSTDSSAATTTGTPVDTPTAPPTTGATSPR